MSREACFWDNVPIESFWGLLKEQTGPTAHLTPSQVTQTVDDCIHYYNEKRGQARLGWETPMEYGTAPTA